MPYYPPPGSSSVAVGSVTGLGTGVATSLAVNNNAAGGYTPIDGAATLSNKTITGLLLTAGTTSVAPVTYASGTNLTNAAAGAVEYDGKVHYTTHAASERGVDLSTQWIGLTGAYTLTSQTGAQALFNAPANGRVTVAANMTYRFRCVFSLTSMSSTSGTFGFAIAGTATTSGVMWQFSGAKNALNAAAATSGACVTGTLLPVANALLTSANTNTAAWADIVGQMRVTVGGTIIPQVSLGVAAAAIVGVDSYFEIYPVGADTTQSVGNWS